MKETTENFKVGTKVKISKSCGFDSGVVGTVKNAPMVSVLAEDFCGHYFRKVKTLKGEVAYLWIVFDKPQYDRDGDGPYTQAEIAIDCLKIIDE